MRYAALLIPSHAVDAEESEEREEACSHRWQEEEARKTQQEGTGGEKTAAGGRGTRYACGRGIEPFQSYWLCIVSIRSPSDFQAMETISTGFVGDASAPSPRTGGNMPFVTEGCRTCTWSG